jgi:uncharacterized protein (TIGR02271 family)
MEHEERNDRFTAIEDQYAGYEIYDRNGDKIGKVDDLFVDENDAPEYIGVKMGFLGTRSTLIPWEVATVDENDRRIEVSVDKAQAKEGPAFDDDEDITPDYEERVYSHYGLSSPRGSTNRDAYGDYYGDDEDELRVERSEEELRAGTREREAGRMNVRKRVLTDREQVKVPTRHEEVSVERVPVDEEGTGAEIGDDEVSVPVVEDEVVVDKRPVVKEEVRVRKDIVEDEEVIEEDVRKEEIDVDDQTTVRGRDRDVDLDDETGRRGR